MGSYIKLEREQQQSSLDVIKVLENKQCHIKREEGEGGLLKSGQRLGKLDKSMPLSNRGYSHYLPKIQSRECPVLHMTQ